MVVKILTSKHHLFKLLSDADVLLQLPSNVYLSKTFNFNQNLWGVFVHNLISDGTDDHIESA